MSTTGALVKAGNVGPAFLPPVGAYETTLDRVIPHATYERSGDLGCCVDEFDGERFENALTAPAGGLIPDAPAFFLPPVGTFKACRVSICGLKNNWQRRLGSTYSSCRRNGLGCSWTCVLLTASWDLLVGSCQLIHNITND